MLRQIVPPLCSYMLFLLTARLEKIGMAIKEIIQYQTIS